MTIYIVLKHFRQFPARWHQSQYYTTSYAFNYIYVFLSRRIFGLFLLIKPLLVFDYTRQVMS